MYHSHRSSSLMAIFATILQYHEVHCSNIVDLSLKFNVSDLNNPGAKLIEKKIVPKVPETRRLLVLEKGQIVADYIRKDVDPNQGFILWSAQKSIDSLLFGLAIESGKLSLTETLGDVFPDEELWSDDPDADYKKSVTIYELLTMTSGLVANYIPIDCCYDAETSSNPNHCPECGDEPGKDLKEALSFLVVNATRGEWNYIDSTNVYSYIIKAKTSMTPRELMAKEIFPALGINDKDIGWRTNSDGMDVLTWGMYLTADQMAKFGQLILQDGMGAQDKSILSSDWVKNTTMKWVEMEPDGYYGFWWYGFWWYIYNGDTVGNDDIGEFYCAIGSQAQYICIYPELQRVFVRQSDCPYYGCDVDTERLDTILFEASTSFDTVTDTKAGKEKVRQVDKPVIY